MRRAGLSILFATILCTSQLWGQSAQVTTQGLYRTFMIQTAIERGTAFSVDVDRREYWFTAKHLFTGAKSGPAGLYSPKTATASLLSQQANGAPGQDQQWITQTFAIIDPGKDIDILVLVPSKALLPEEGSLNTDAGGVGFGADCEFLGFPYGGGWKAQDVHGNWSWHPYIKHCTISALMRENLQIWVLDGINNEGFSGGPVLFGTGLGQKVFAVISGYHQEVLEVLPALPTSSNPSGLPPPPPGLQPVQGNQAGKQVVIANSGFILAFDIQPAITAIRENPIGPLRTTK